jgi:hypothetical protein
MSQTLNAAIAVVGKDIGKNSFHIVGPRCCRASALLGRLDPRLEPMALPALGFDQHNPSRLHEQDAQVAIAALG